MRFKRFFCGLSIVTFLAAGAAHAAATAHATGPAGVSMQSVLLLCIAVAAAAGGLTAAAFAMRAREARALLAETNAQAAALLQRFAQLTAPNRYGYVDLTRWRAEVREFRRAAPVRCRLLDEASAYGIVTERVMALAEGAGLRAGPESPLLDQRALAHRVADALRALGWRAKIVAASMGAEHHVLAERQDIRAIVLCRAQGRVDHREVERAATARGQLRADLAAVVSNCSASNAAKIFARHMRIGLLSVRQISMVQVAAGKLRKARRSGGNVTPLRPRGAAHRPV